MTNFKTVQLPFYIFQKIEVVNLEMITICKQLNLLARDGKKYRTDVIDDRTV